MEARSDALRPHFVTPVNGTDDREALPKNWVATLVQIRNEKAVGKRLSELQIESYVPTQWEYHQWSDRRKKIERVVIPMIVFVHADKKTERQLITYPFINKVLSYPGQRTPAIIPDDQIERLKFMLNHANSAVEMRDKIPQVGEMVCITRGPLRGLEGELCYFNPERPMVAIRIEHLGYACVNVSKRDIAPQ